jgi:hypothetical protein
MTAALSTLQLSQSLASTEATSRMDIRRPAARSVGFDLERSRQSRRRHRVLASAQQLAALFDCHGDRSRSLQLV